MRSHNLFQGHLWVLIPGQEVHGTKESSPSLGRIFPAGVRVLSLPPNSFLCLPWKNLSVLHCRPQPVSPLLQAISKEVAFLCLLPVLGFSPTLSLHSCCSTSFPLSLYSAAKHCLQAKHSNYAVSTQFNDTAHVNTKKSREFTRNLFNNQKLSLPVGFLPTKLPQL